MSVRAKCAAAVTVGVLLAGGTAFAGPDEDYGGPARFNASLKGLNEVPPISTRGRGRFRAELQGRRIAWELTYSRLEGTVTQSHIHFGQLHVSGGISVWLCGNIATTPAGVQPCPQQGTISGVIEASQVVGPATQGITTGELNEVVRAMRRNATYANVHSTTFPAGEIRGQIKIRRNR